MFDWFTGKLARGEGGLQKIHDEFGKMLEDGRRTFELAASVFLEGGDPGVVRTDLYATDDRINVSEQQIRKMLVVHATVHGMTAVPSCLVLMSIVKDAERVGDYSKNIFDVAVTAPRAAEGEHRRRLVDLKNRILALMADCRSVFESNDKDRARRLIVEAKRIEGECGEGVRELVRGKDVSDMAAAYVMIYRYFKRAASHTRNVASSIVLPLDEIDFTAKITTESGGSPSHEE